MKKILSWSSKNFRHTLYRYIHLRVWIYACILSKIIHTETHSRSSTVTNITSRDLICQQRHRTKSLWRYHISFRLGLVICMYGVTLSLIYISSYTCRRTQTHGIHTNIAAASFLVDTHRHPLRQIDCCIPENLLKVSHLLVHCLLWCWG
jgi:hypothetical protein